MLRKLIATGVVFTAAFLIGSAIRQLSNMTSQEWIVFTATLRAFGFTTLFFIYTLGILTIGAFIYHKVTSSSLDASKFRLNNSKIQLNNARQGQIRHKMMRTFFDLPDDIPQMASNPEAITISSPKRHALPGGQDNDLGYYTIDNMTDSEDDFNFSDFETEL